MSGHGRFEAAVDGLSDLTRVSEDPYLATYRGRLRTEDGRQIVQLRTVPADAVGDRDDLSEAIRGAIRSWRQAATHPNVAELLRVGDEPRPWALVADQPRTFAAARPGMNVQEACRVVGDAAEALRNAALYNLSHGDLSPRHVRVAPDGAVTVDDWGLVRAVATYTDGSYVTGYTAPERLADDVTATAEQTDVYGLGALAYFALTGRPPHGADEAAILAGDPTPPSEVHDALPAAVDGPVLRALDPDPDARHDGIYSFAVAFEEAAADLDDGSVIGPPASRPRPRPSERLRSIAGVDASVADSLRAAGLHTVDRVRAASTEELADVPGIGTALAARIEADLDGESAEVSAVAPSDEDVENQDSAAPERDERVGDAAASMSPEELAGDAEGNVSEEQLTESDSNRPLWEHLRPGERPHYYFHNVNKGLKIEHPDRDEAETPYNVGYSHRGDRFLLVTDRRVLFVGGDVEGSDEVVGFPYADLVDVEASQGWTKERLTVEHADGRRISFYGRGQAAHIDDAGEYVAARIDDASDRQNSDRQSDGRDAAGVGESARTEATAASADTDGRRDDLTRVSGVGVAEARTLREKGYETLADLERASQSDLASVPGIGNALAARIAADVEALDVSAASGESPGDAGDSPGDDGDPLTGSDHEGTDAATDGADAVADADDARSVEEIVAGAAGNVTDEHLTESESARPLRAYLRSDEQPHYYFHHVAKGLRFERPDWDEKKTPYNVGYGHSGDCYLLVTDQRFLFVAGETEGEDTVVSFPYSALRDADANWGWLKNRLTVEHEDGREISFFDQGGQGEHVEDAGEYVAERIEEVGTTETTGSESTGDDSTAVAAGSVATADETTSASASDGGTGPAVDALGPSSDDGGRSETDDDRQSKYGDAVGYEPERTGETESESEQTADAESGAVEKTVPSADPGAEAVTDGTDDDAATGSGNESDQAADQTLSFCPACGEDLRQLDQAPAYCPSCGEDLSAY